MLVTLLVLVSLALVVAIAFLIFGPSRTAQPAATAKSSAALADPQAQKAAEAELEKRKRELDEQRNQITELKAELKQAKRKLYELKESSKDEHDLVKARAEVERNASIQLEQVRAELSSALTEMAKLREAAEKGGRRERPAPAAAAAHPPAAVPAPVAAAPVAAAPVTAAPAAAPAEKPAKKTRELTDAEREKMERLEHLANKDRARATELDREVKRLKGKVETQSRIYVVTKGELDLLKDKFKALEKRLNRTLLEKDLVQRAIADLAKKSGVDAGRTELTSEEIAASDQKVEERIAAEAAQVKTIEAEAMPAQAIEAESAKQEQV